MRLITVVVLPVPGGPYKSKLGKYLFFNMVKNIFLLVGSRTMSSNLLGRYFSVHGIFSVFEFIGDRDFTQILSIFLFLRRIFHLFILILGFPFIILGFPFIFIGFPFIILGFPFISSFTTFIFTCSIRIYF